MQVGWLFLLLIAQRLLELAVTRRNLRVMLARGGRELYPETFLPIAALHIMFLVSLVIESVPWRIPLDTVTWGCLAGYLLLQVLRYWSMVSLGEWWSARIVLIPGGKVKRDGPYRFFRHPHYLVVTLEFILLPLLLRSPLCFAAYFPVNILILRHRIVLEEKALREMTDYAERFGIPS
ncbi:isoprenylcysteine carboxylmethyltransferase family protein [Geobacter sp. DSM 9736]|uniref:isoprenylcysteine carboxylmethyltransferase family protein n=1 Tax=Geobacter sp. DSM 9736 TaxID=1277350 RepID=UPI000B60845D|nr:isoprenylcysteine carboxylmethyltransferase family protein [Geobacter sp. DSM 9736]SNB45915.1 15-methylpalmitoyl-4-hydroxy-2-pyrone 4-O-methyltransferase [Geobacter sp. DSM 9736]